MALAGFITVGVLAAESLPLEWRVVTLEMVDDVGESLRDSQVLQDHALVYCGGFAAIGTIGRPAVFDDEDEHCRGATEHEHDGLFPERFA